jgi:predicted RNase H-like nuclease
MSTDGFVIVEYHAGSGNPTVPSKELFNDVEQAQRVARERQLDRIQARRHDRIGVARIEVLP